MAAAVTIVWVVLRSARRLVEAQAPTQMKQLALLEHVTYLAAAKDVAAFQGLMVMGQDMPSYDEPYDPSEEALARKEAEARGLDFEEISNAEQQQLQQLFE